jgi:hypothetical protein
MTPEGKVKKIVRAYLDSLAPDVWYFMPVPTGFSDKGTPDFIINFYGRFIAIETKATEKQKPTPLQQKALDGIHGAHGIVFVANAQNVQGVIECLTTLAQALSDS